MTEENAAAEALATEEVVEETVIEEVAEELSEEETAREDLAAAYDKAQEPDESEAEHPAVDIVDETPESEPVLEIPTDLPGDIKGMWGELPENARTAFLTNYRDLSAKHSQATRDLQGIGPIRDAVYKAAKEIPGFTDMTPEQIANDVYGLAQAGQALKADPVKALRGLARQHGINLQDLAGGDIPAGEAHNADNQIATLQNEIQGLQRQLQTQLDPSRMRETFSAWDQERSLQSEITEFAATQENWATVEPHLPTVIPVAQAKLGPNATPSEVLQEAYQLAVNTFAPSTTKALHVVGEEPTPQAPERVKAAVKAKSVNVQSKTSGKSAPLTDREAMAATWDRLNAE